MVKVGDIYRNLDLYDGEGDLVVITVGTVLGENTAKCEHINNTKHLGLNGSTEIKDFTDLKGSYRKVGFMDLEALSLANDILSQSNRHKRASNLKRHLVTDLEIIETKIKRLLNLLSPKPEK